METTTPSTPVVQTPAPVAPPTPAPAAAPAPAPSFVQQLVATEPFSIESRFRKAEETAPAPTAVAAPVEPAATTVDPAAPVDPNAPAEPAAAPANPLENLSAEQLVEHFKKEHPDAHPSVWKRLADREVTYQTQQAKIRELEEANSKLGRMAQERKAQPPQLTEFERSLQTPPAAPVAPVQQQVAQPVQPPVQQPQPPVAQQPDAVGQIIQEWGGNASMAVPAEAEAWTAFHQATNLQEQAAAHQRIMAIREAQTRILNAPFANFLQQQMQSMLNEFRQEMGQQIAPVQQIAEQRQLQADHNFAVSELKRTGVDVANLFAPDGQGQIEIDGEMVESSPINRIAASNPWLNQIQVTKDAQGRPLSKENANKATLIAQYRAAHSLLATLGIQAPASAQPAVQPQPPTASAPLTPEAAALIEQGRQQAQRELMQDRTRQSVNAGTTASGVGNGGTQTYVQSLLQGAGSTSIESRFRR